MDNDHRRFTEGLEIEDLLIRALTPVWGQYARCADTYRCGILIGRIAPDPAEAAALARGIADLMLSGDGPADPDHPWQISPVYGLWQLLLTEDRERSLPQDTASGLEAFRAGLKRDVGRALLELGSGLIAPETPAGSYGRMPTFACVCNVRGRATRLLKWGLDREGKLHCLFSDFRIPLAGAPLLLRLAQEGGYSGERVRDILCTFRCKKAPSQGELLESRRRRRKCL